MHYSPSELNDLENAYSETLIDETIPFWLPRSVDEEFGGYLIARDRDGSLVDDDKSVWQQGRFAWMLATLYNTVDQRTDWLAAASSGIEFIRDHCYDTEGDGRLFFHMTRDGTPIRKRRYYFSECFASIAAAAYAKAANDGRSADEAASLFDKCLDFYEHPEKLPAKFTSNRPAKAIGPPMILLNVAQQLRETIAIDNADAKIDRFIEDIQSFVKPELECVMEQVTPDGSIIDPLRRTHVESRTCDRVCLVYLARGQASQR